MSKATEKRLAQEAAFPVRFSDGSAWVAIADAMAREPAMRDYTREAWPGVTGFVGGDIPSQFSAPGAAIHRPAYEEERLRAQLVTRAGEETVRDAMRAHAEALRRARSPNEVTPHKIALIVLAEALRVPARRKTFMQIAKAADLMPAQPRRRR